jgi:hypothetical protein
LRDKLCKDSRTHCTHIIPTAVTSLLFHIRTEKRIKIEKFLVNRHHTRTEYPGESECLLVNTLIIIKPDNNDYDNNNNNTVKHTINTYDKYEPQSVSVNSIYRL